MTRRYLNWLFAGAVAFSMIGIAACGGNDDDGQTGDSDPENGAAASPDTSPDSGAENGDDNGNNQGGAGGASSEDESYIRTMCTAIMAFEMDSREATSDIDQESGQEEVMQALAGPFRDLAEATAQADPPSDLQGSHEDMVSNLQDVASALESGDPDAMQQMQAVQIDPEVQQRMATVGQDLEECEGLFGAPGGGNQPGGTQESGTQESGGGTE